MSQQLVNDFQQLITPSRIEKLKILLGDEPDEINNAFTAAVPVALNGIIGKCGTADGTGKILHACHDAQSKDLIGNIDTIFSGGGEWTHYGKNLLSNIFGSNEGPIVQKISDSQGTKKSSTHNILVITVLLLLGLLGKHVANNKMDNKGFIHYLLSHLGTLGSLFPAGLSAAALPGLLTNEQLKHKLEAVAFGLSGSTGPLVQPLVGKPQRKRRSVLPWLLLLLVLGGLLWWLFGGKKNKAEPAAVVADTSVVTPVLTKTATIDTVAHTVTLPNDSLFHVSKGTMEYKLVEFLNDPARQADKDVWFDFDNINFDLDKADLTKESSLQLDNIAAILKAYPKTKVKVGGYTDRAGKEDHNMKLSQARAEAVFNALKERGVNSDQLTGAEGYGSQFATLPATASDEQRRVDRRMSLSVREK